jgi:hypothetical protein
LKNEIVFNNKIIVANEKKKTKDEIKQSNIERTEMQRKILRDKYNNDEYKSVRAKQITENRKKRSEI